MSRRFALRTSVPIGSTLVLAMITPPLGYVQDTAFNDRVLVFTSGAGLGTAGSVSANNGAGQANTGGPTGTGTTSLSTAQLAAHRHKLQTAATPSGAGSATGWSESDFIATLDHNTNKESVGDVEDTEPANVGSGSTHVHTVAQHTHVVNYNFKIREVIAAKRIF